MKRKRSKFREMLIVPVIAVMFIAGGYAITLVFNGDKTIQNNSQDANAQPADPKVVAVDPCVLFSHEKIEEIFSAKFSTGIVSEKPAEPNSPVATECLYRQINDGTEEGLAEAYSLNVLVETHASPEAAKGYLEDTSKDAKQVEDVGEQAYFRINQEQAELYLQNGKQLIRLSVKKDSGINETIEQIRLETLAKLEF